MARLGDCALSQLNHQLNHDVIVSLCVLEYIRQVFVQRRLLFVDRFLFDWEWRWENAHPIRQSQSKTQTVAVQLNQSMATVATV